jgi:beta-N-acetylglucosaminidase
MKKLIIINIILLLFVYILPTKENKVVNNIKNVIIQNTVEVIPEEVKIEPIINLDLTTTSDLRTPSNLKAEDYNKMLEGTNLYGIGAALEQAEREHNINGLYLMGLACLESGYRNI